MQAKYRALNSKHAEPCLEPEQHLLSQLVWTFRLFQPFLLALPLETGQQKLERLHRSASMTILLVWTFRLFFQPFLLALPIETGQQKLERLHRSASMTILLVWTFRLFFQPFLPALPLETGQQKLEKLHRSRRIIPNQWQSLLSALCSSPGWISSWHLCGLNMLHEFNVRHCTR